MVLKGSGYGSDAGYRARWRSNASLRAGPSRRDAIKPASAEPCEKPMTPSKGPFFLIRLLTYRGFVVGRQGALEYHAI